METLDELKEIIKNAPKDGTATNIDADGDYIRYRGGLIEYYFPTGVWLEVEWCDFRVVRSLSDIKLIIELMESNKEAKKSALLSLKEAIEPDGLINSDAGLKTIRTIQNAINEIVSQL